MCVCGWLCLTFLLRYRQSVVKVNLDVLLTAIKETAAIFCRWVRLREGLQTYPDGKITARLRGNIPIADTVAGYFGGGGHPYAAGFRIYEDYDTVVRELLDITDKTLREYEA